MYLQVINIIKYVPILTSNYGKLIFFASLIK